MQTQEQTRAESSCEKSLSYSSLRSVSCHLAKANWRYLGFLAFNLSRRGFSSTVTICSALKIISRFMWSCAQNLSWLHASFELLALCSPDVISSILFQACNYCPFQIVQTSLYARHFYLLIHWRPHDPWHHRRRLVQVQHRHSFRSLLRCQFLQSHCHQCCHLS